jgi:hypothetical protein
MKTNTQETGIVPIMINAASQAKIEVHSLCRSISVLKGSREYCRPHRQRWQASHRRGFTVSRPGIASALDSLSVDPITQLINTPWHVVHTDGNAWLQRRLSAWQGLFREGVY